MPESSFFFWRSINANSGVEEAKRAVSLWVDPASQLRAQKCSQFCFHWSPSFRDIWSVGDSFLSLLLSTLFCPFLLLFFLSRLSSRVLFKRLEQCNFKHKEKSEEKESKSSQLVTKKKHLQAKHLAKNLGAMVMILMMITLMMRRALNMIFRQHYGVMNNHRESGEADNKRVGWVVVDKRGAQRVHDQL